MERTPDDYIGGGLLLFDGDLPSEELLDQLCQTHSPIVAADGAALTLRERGIEPDIIIGDLDTVGREVDDEFARSRVIRDESQEEYDGAKGLQWLLARGVDRVTVLGCGGGMIDHVVNNFSILSRFADRLAIRICDDHSVGYYTTGTLRLETGEDERVSLLPMPTAQVNTAGLFWELEGGELTWGVREGNSNRATGGEVAVHVSHGLLLVVHYPILP